ncbi:MAG TPA: hypothetical protein VJP59_10740, partial [Gemmatimonadota bacterium]|nr:hypothetical protein [Gemmatimonadota bacterium]
GGYDRIPFDGRTVQPHAFFRRMSDAGRRVGLLNVPFLDPIPPLAGFAVSGDEGVGPEFAAPSDVLAELQRIGYVVPFGASYAPGREDAFHRHVQAVLRMQHEALRTLFRRRPWDFGMLCLYAVGELLHAFWRFYDPRRPGHRPAAAVFGDRDPLLESLQSVDRMVDDILGFTGPDGLVIVMSAWEHRLEAERLHLNTFLHRRGLLAFRTGPSTRLKRTAFRLGLGADTAERLAHRLDLYKRLHYGASRSDRARVTGSTFLSHEDVDWSRTRAVALGYLGQIHLNVRGRRPAGTIAPEDYERFRSGLREELMDLRHPASGNRVVERVRVREELYSGPELEDAPDLVVECRGGLVPESGFRGGGRLVTSSPSNRSSEHSNRGFLFAGGPGIRSGEVEGRLEDVAPTVLHALGVMGHSDGDGGVLDIFL